MNIVDTLEDVWTEDRFWQNDLWNPEQTRFCIIGMTLPECPYLSDDEKKVLLNVVLRHNDLSRNTIFTIIDINNVLGREAVIQELRTVTK